jgi:hypothetical protein
MAKAVKEKKHRVKCSMQVLELTKAGSSMEFEVFADGEKIGRIVMGQGSVTWYGARRQKGWQFSWTEFAKIMDERCYS